MASRGRVLVRDGGIPLPSSVSGIPARYARVNGSSSALLDAAVVAMPPSYSHLAAPTSPATGPDRTTVDGSRQGSARGAGWAGTRPGGRMVAFDKGPPAAVAQHFAELPDIAPKFRSLFWYDWGPVF